MPGESDRETPPVRPRGRRRRAVRGLLLAIPGLFLLYLLAANLLLQTPLVEALTNERPEKLLITYRRAFTFFPGHVLAYDVVVRNQASRSQLQISAERVWAVANPLPLFEKEVRIVAGKVWGPKVWLRSRPETVDEQRAAEPFVPPIEGLPFSLREPLRLPPPSPWKVVVESVEVFEVREFWYQFLRAEGPGTVKGAFAVGPESLIEVRWKLCDFPALKLLYRNETVLPAAALQSNGTIEPVETREVETATILEHMSGHARVSGVAPAGLGVLQPFLRSAQTLSLGGEPIEYDVELELARGAVGARSQAHFRCSRAEASSGDFRGQLGFVLNGDIAGDGALVVEVSASELAVGATGADAPSGQMRQSHLLLRVPSFSLLEPPEQAAVELVLADLQLDHALALARRHGPPRTAPRLDVALKGNTIVTAEITRDENDAVSARWDRLELPDLQAILEDRTIVRSGRLTSSGRLGPVPREGAAARAWLATLSGSADLELVIGPELAALQPLLGQDAGFSLSGGPLRLVLKGAVDHGRPAAGSSLSLRAGSVGIRAGRDLAARGALDLDAVLTGDGAGSADVALRGLEVRSGPSDGMAIRGESVDLRAKGEGVTLYALPRQLTVDALLSSLRYEGTLPPRGPAVSVSAAGPVQVGAEATSVPGEGTRLRWGPLEIPGLAVRLNGQPLLEDLRLATSGTLGPVALSGPVDGRRLLATVSGRLDLAASSPAGLPGVRALLPADAPVTLGGTGARLAAAIEVERGSVLPGSRVTLQSDALEVTSAGVVARASVDVAAQLGPDEELALETTLGDLRVTHPGTDSAAGRGERVVLTARAPLGALRAPRRALDFELTLSDLHLDDVTRLDDPLPQKVQEDIGPDDLRLDLALAGTARVAGNLALGPGSEFLLDCDTVDFPRFDLDVDGTALFERATLVGRATLGPYDFGARGRGGILPVTSGRALLTARTAAGLRALDNLLKNVTWLEIEGGLGFVTLEAVAEKGSLRPGSSATLQLDDLALSVTDFRAGGDADVRAWIGSDAGGEFGALEARLANVKVSRKGTQGLAEAEGVTLTARTRELRLGRTPEDVEVKLTLENARLDTIVGLNGLLPKGTGVTFTDGSARVDAELTASSSGRDGSGTIRVRGEKLAMSAPGYDFVGDVAVDVPLAEGNLHEGRFEIDGATVGLKNFSVAGGQTGHGDWTTGWWADLGLDDASLRLKGDVTADGSVSFRMRDTAPIVQFFTARSPIPRFLARVLAVRDVSGDASIVYSPERLEVRDLEVVSDRAQAEARLTVDDNKPFGQLLIVYDWIGIGIGLDGRKTDLDLLGARHWYARLGPNPPEDLDAYVDEEVRRWRETQRSLRESAGTTPESRR